MENNIDSNNKNEELIEFPANLDQLNKWTIPSVPSKDIYKF
jgi:hypothetical protein